jgi:hypothetical protein
MYDNKHVTVKLTLPQGGGIFSFSPVAKGIDPTGQSLGIASVVTPADITPAFSNLKSASITDPFKPHSLSLNYENWNLGT